MNPMSMPQATRTSAALAAPRRGGRSAPRRCDAAGHRCGGRCAARGAMLLATRRSARSGIGLGEIVLGTILSHVPLRARPHVGVAGRPGHHVAAAAAAGGARRAGRARCWRRVARPTRACCATRSPTRTCSGWRPVPGSGATAVIVAGPAVAAAAGGGVRRRGARRRADLRRRGRRRRPRARGYAIILAGVAVAAMLTAVQTYLQQQHTEEIRQIYNWILGSFSVASWSDVRLVLPYLVGELRRPARPPPDPRRAAGRGEEAGALGIHPGAHPADHRGRGDARHRRRGVGQRADRLRRHHRAARRAAHDQRELPGRPAGVDDRRRGVPRPGRPGRPHRAGADRDADRRGDRGRRRAVLPLRAAVAPQPARRAL